MSTTVILGAARTPFGKMGGALKSFDATDLGGLAISSALERAEIELLRACLDRVITTAVSVQAEKARFPAEWLFHRRWPQSREKSIEGRNVVRETIAGRTTAWVPDVQH